MSSAVLFKAEQLCDYFHVLIKRFYTDHITELSELSRKHPGYRILKLVAKFAKSQIESQEVKFTP